MRLIVTSLVATSGQAEWYEIGRVTVSDFVLPAYFTPGEERGLRTTYLGRKLPSFGVAAGGYIGFFDPQLGDCDVHFADEAGKAAFDKKRIRGRLFARSLRRTWRT